MSDYVVDVTTTFTIPIDLWHLFEQRCENVSQKPTDVFAQLAGYAVHMLLKQSLDAGVDDA